MVENFTPAVAERSVIDQKEQISDFVRGDFIEKKTEEEEFEEALQREFQQVQEALEQEINAGMADVRVKDGEIEVTLVESSSGAGSEGSEGKGKGGLVAQATIDAVAKIADVSSRITSTVGIHVSDKSEGAGQGAPSTASNSVREGGSGLSKYDQLRADLQDEIARGLAEVEREGDKIIVRLASQGGFVSGSAGVRDSFSPTLIKLGNTLSKYSGIVKVEGHQQGRHVSKRRHPSRSSAFAGWAIILRTLLDLLNHTRNGNSRFFGRNIRRTIDFRGLSLWGFYWLCDDCFV